MIETIDKECLVSLIQLKNCINNNDVEAAKVLVDTLNALAADENVALSYTLTINDQVYEGALYELCQSADAAKYIINNVDCIGDKEYRIAVIDACKVMQDGDLEVMNQYIENILETGIDLSAELNQSFYVQMLLKMCFATKRFDLMDKIHAALEEVV